MTEERRKLGLPDRRKNTYEELERKLVEEIKEITDWLRSLVRKGIIAISILGLACALALVGYGYLLRQQHKTTDEIQSQRKEFVRRTCVDQNKRHDKTLRVLSHIVDVAEHKHPELRKAYEDSRAQNLLLINALAPKQNCVVAVKAAIASPATKGGN